MGLRLRCCGITPTDYVGRHLLDAGCGTGEYACWFASQGAEVTGIDLSDGSLQGARAYADRVGLERVRFEKRSVLETGFPDAAFDFIYCTGVLHHTPDPFAGLSELVRVLRPGGTILVSLYHRLGLMRGDLQRRLVRRFGGDDLDARVRWGRRLFPGVTRRNMGDDYHDPQTVLYDHFAIPHQSLHTVGQMLRWFDRLGLRYLGAFPPARLRDYLPMLACDEYKSVEPEIQSRLGRTLGRLGTPEKMGRDRPGPFSRFTVQTLWGACGIGVFSVGGRKPDAETSN
jgi:SAM-dependent methyltransferase